MIIVTGALWIALACEKPAASEPVHTPAPGAVEPAPPAEAGPATPAVAAAATPAEVAEVAVPAETTAPAVVATPRPQAPSGWRPCELTVQPCKKKGKSCAEIGQCIVTLVRFIPEGVPLDLNLTGPETTRWRYADDGRLLEGPYWNYEHTDATSGFRSRKDGSERVPIQFDGQGRVTVVGDDFRFDYLPDGRTAGYSARGKSGKWKQKVSYRWGKNQKYHVQWTYPDSSEFCEPDPSAVRLDGDGRVVREVYEECQINYSAFNLRYHYDAAGRPDVLDVECGSDADKIVWKLALKYECPGAAPPV